MSFKDEQGQASLVLFLLIVLIGLMGAGVYMLDQIGLINAREQILTRTRSIPVVGEYLIAEPKPTEGVLRDELRQYERRLEQQATKLDRRRAALQEREQELQNERQQLEQERQQLQQRERALAERRTRFEEEEQRYEYLAELYSGMQPQASAQRIQQIEEDRIVIAILRRMESQTASIIMSQMNPNRASEISRKIAQYPDF